MTTTKINSGSVATGKDDDGNAVYDAQTHLDPHKPAARFYSFNGAVFWLWLIETRIMGRRMRLGTSA